MPAKAPPGIPSCFTCPVGRASGVGSGGACPFETRLRRRGEVIHAQGDPATTVYLVKRGTVALSRVSADGKEHVQAIRGAGAFLGLEALVRPTYQEQAQTLTQTSLCAASRESVDGWLGAPGTPARSALEQVLESYAADMPRLSSVEGTALERVARWICEQAPEGVAHALPRRTTASLLGMAPETFSRALAELARRKLVKLSRTHLEVEDGAALARLSARTSRPP